MQYDLAERTEKFGIRIIDLCRRVSKNQLTIPLLDQLIRCGTSIGANYAEATGAASKKDFRNKCFICKKESIETKYWLKMLMHADPSAKDECEKLLKEAHELTLIFSKICGNSK